jgi:hypothetical protein
MTYALGRFAVFYPDHPGASKGPVDRFGRGRHLSRDPGFYLSSCGIVGGAVGELRFLLTAPKPISQDAKRQQTRYKEYDTKQLPISAVIMVAGPCPEPCAGAHRALCYQTTR